MLTLTTDNALLREMPGDPETGPRLRQVHGAAWSRVDPTPVAAPRLLAASREMLEALGWTEADAEDPTFAEVFAGNRLLPGMQPWATAYGGHQFGQWAGQLGDGRAISLCEAIAPDGRRWELQLKGAGPTPYSRRADGRAVLRSSLREFLCSEAMHHLGVPTTRALSLVATGDAVVRDMFYDGNARPEPGAICCRVAPSFTRLGHFELPASRGDHALLQRWVDFTLARDFPDIQARGAEGAVALVDAVCRRTALLLAHWMRVGFVHGVMNTDNLSVLGLTIDYGPYGWIDNFDADWTPNTTDAEGRRYRFGTQPQVAHWNLGRFAGALLPLLDSPAPLQQALDAYAREFKQQHARMSADKLGLPCDSADSVELMRRCYTVLQDGELDMTLFFRHLSELDPAAPDPAPLAIAAYAPGRWDAVQPALRDWLGDWGRRLGEAGEAQAARSARMNAANPRYVPRNYLAQEAIDLAEQGDNSRLIELLDLFRQPYTVQPERDHYAARRPDWARHRAGCSMLSCSS